MVPASFIFMIGVSIALLVSYRLAEAQNDNLKTHVANALTMRTIIIALGKNQSMFYAFMTIGKR